MNIKTIFLVRDQPLFPSVALLLLRVVAGGAFMFHGWPKIQNPLNWMGPDGFAPAYLQAFAAIAEFGGGLAWVLGLVMPVASLAIACTMAVAFWMHAILSGDPFVSSTGGAAYELAAVYFSVAILFLATGPGRLSLDRAFFGRR